MNIQTTISPAQALLASCVPQKSLATLVTELQGFIDQSDKLDRECQAAFKRGDQAEHMRLGDEWSAVDDRIYLHRTAIRAAVDAMLPEGVTLETLGRIL